MATRTTGASLLNQAYADLDLRRGRLVSPTDSPRRGRPTDEWSSIGDWLILAERMGAERIFFVGDDPVVLFAKMPPGSTESNVVETYKRAWSLSRPQCLFLATSDELRVYALSAPPPNPSDSTEELRPIEVVRRAADVAGVLAAFHRERLESGDIFEGNQFRDRAGRADAQLLHDVRTATNMLVEGGLGTAVAHALVERVILVRYLEDRKVITRTYFDAVAERDPTWRTILEGDALDLESGDTGLIRCLLNKALTYAVFERLSVDFNGDLFLPAKDEQVIVNDSHLDLLRQLLIGKGLDPQQRLFLWAYDFSVVPTSLISSMYEQFYRDATDDGGGTHYTSSELVEYILAQVLTTETLHDNPSVLDPTCGSGIFLVEAYRRIVRHEMTRQRRSLSSSELRTLLLTRVAGIDVNAEAIRLAAFSLYLAFLNYQSPQDIRQAGPLPRLIYDDASGTREPGRVLAIADAFAPTQTEISDEDWSELQQLPWESHTFDVVVGNPPWDEPSGRAYRSGDAWTRRESHPVGDRNPSQQFLWRALTFLKPGGSAALLVAATAFHNRRKNSKAFRSEWLASVALEAVTDFSTSRGLFFDDAVAPFLLVEFRHARSISPAPTILFRAVRPSQALASSRSVRFARVERRWVSQSSLRERDYLWKTYAWGAHRDDALMSRLDVEEVLAKYLPGSPDAGYGYQRGGTDEPSKVLAELPSLARLEPWGPLDRAWFEDPPRLVKRQPDERLYSGQRILVSEGVRAGFGPNARLVDVPLSFRHIFYCLPLHGVPTWQAKVILGVILSSLGRYRLFMTSGSWGLWHDKFNSGDFLNLPMRVGTFRDDRTVRIRKAVEQLGSVTGAELDLEGDRESVPPKPVSVILKELDRAIYELFELTPAECDLIDDFVHFTFPLVGRSRAWLMPEQVALDSARTYGEAADVGRTHPLAPYLRTFLAAWNRELGDKGQLSWRLIDSVRTQLIAAVFETVPHGSVIEAGPDGDDWQEVLDRLSTSLQVPISSAFFTEGVVRAVSDTAIVVIKRSDRRLWTASSAREDVDATFVQAMSLRGL